MKVLFLFPYPVGHAASQRFRFEQYLDIIAQNDIDYHLSPFLDETSWKIFYKKGHYFRKTLALLQGFIRRLFVLPLIAKYDYVFIHREALPIGPPVIEFFIAKVFRKKIVYDFDDAIWLSNSSESNRFFEPLKTHSNVFAICRWAHKLSVGNEYLMNAVIPHNQNVVINPTTIDTKLHHNRLSEHDSELLTIGWTGSHSTTKYLDLIYDVIRDIKTKYNCRFVVISDIAPTNNSDLFEFIEWKKSSEIDDLLAIDIGIMPLSHDPWSEGKCGFKALQYMALGIPALVSPVGVNEEIVDDGINGFVCKTKDDWFEKIEYLIKNRPELKTMGKEARKKIEDRYSVTSNTSNFIHLFS